MNIFLLPGLGARATSIDGDENSELIDLQRTLGAFGPVCILQHMPDIDSPGETCSDIERVVEDLVGRIQGADDPIVVGYSIGGYLAFETCRRLAARGAPVRRLLMIDSSAFFVRPARTPLRVELVQTLRQGVGKAMIVAPFVTALRHDRLEFARRWLVCIGRLTGRRRLAGLRTQLLVAYWFQATDRFELAPYSGPVILFKASKGRPRIVDATLGWGSLAPALRVRLVPGDHWTMLRSPDLAREVTTELRGLERRVATDTD